VKPLIFGMCLMLLVRAMPLLWDPYVWRLCWMIY